MGEDKDRRQQENKKGFSASSMLLFAYNCVMDGGLADVNLFKGWLLRSSLNIIVAQ